MRSIDIRDCDKDEPITMIRFASGNGLHSAVEVQTYPGEYEVFINSGAECSSGRVGNNQFVLLDSEEDAKNLIKALERAIELDWWDR